VTHHWVPFHGSAHWRVDSGPQEALRHLVAHVGQGQVVLGTDHPIPWEEHPVDHVMATTTLSQAQRTAILGGNAARLLNLKDI
jgi:predicted TIM-barrel fold metal-dependent hydrolase